MKPENPPAFPMQTDLVVNYGMSLRDYFASKVITSSLLNVSEKSHLELAKRAYEIADAMLKQREL
jgi:hypothetical protein